MSDNMPTCAVKCPRESPKKESGAAVTLGFPAQDLTAACRREAVECGTETGILVIVTVQADLRDTEGSVQTPAIQEYLSKVSPTNVLVSQCYGSYVYTICIYLYQMCNNRMFKKAMYTLQLKKYFVAEKW